MNINDLPPELLTHIFLSGTVSEKRDEAGAWEEDEEGGEEDDVYDLEKERAAGRNGIPFYLSLGGAVQVAVLPEAALRQSRRKITAETPNTLSETPASNVASEFPVVVSHVCRHWREVALEAPMLWTFLDFSEGPPFTKSKVFIERSKDCDLEINIEYTDEEPDEADEEEIVPRPLDDLERMLQILMPHVARWFHFTLSVSYHDHMAVAVENYLSKHGPAPRLQVLELYDNHEEGDEEEIDSLSELPMLFNGVMPSLKAITLFGVHVDWERATYLRNLENLELAYHEDPLLPTWDQFATILLESPKLHTLSIAASGPDREDSQWPKDIIHLDSLEHLSVAFVRHDYCASLLQRLELPRLRDLALDLEEGTTGTQSESALVTRLVDPKHNIASQLELLKIETFSDAQDSDIHKLYSHTTSLVSLELNMRWLNTTFLTCVREEPLPHLETLTLMNLNTLVEELKSVVEGRKKLGVPLKKVVLNSNEDIPESLLVWLRERVPILELIDVEDDDESMTEEDPDHEGVDDEGPLGPLFIDVDDGGDGNAMDVD